MENSQKRLVNTQLLPSGSIARESFCPLPLAKVLPLAIIKWKGVVKQLTLSLIRKFSTKYFLPNESGAVNVAVAISTFQ